LFQQLDHTTGRAETHLQGEVVFIPELFGKQEAISQGHVAKIDKRL